MPDPLIRTVHLRKDYRTDASIVHALRHIDLTVHSGEFVAITGPSGSGKSTLMNSLLGQKLAITNIKPQTTRKKIAGILSEDNFQIIFLDTPGLLSPAYLLQEKMVKEILSSVKPANKVIPYGST